MGRHKIEGTDGRIHRAKSIEESFGLGLTLMIRNLTF